MCRVDNLYASLDVETRIVVQQRTNEIKVLMRRTAQDIVEIGQKLIDVKVQLGHGLFSAWLHVEFEWSRGTAENSMAVARRFQNQKISDFDVAPSALYMLAAPSTPESAREEALARAETGERITHSIAHEIVAAHRVAPVSLQREPVVEGCAVAEDGIQSSGRGPLPTARQQPCLIDLARDAPHEMAPKAEAASQSVGATHKMAVHFSSRTVEHCTPESIIEPTLTCLGGIDLDPCSEGGDQPNVPAHTHYTADDDGLARRWHGRVYMNPPYGREIGDWVEKLCSEHEAGRVIEAIALLPSRTDTQWWKRLRNYQVCFVQGRLTFVGSQDPAPFPSAVFYLGRDIARFCCAFGHLGDVYQRLATREQR